MGVRMRENVIRFENFGPGQFDVKIIPFEDNPDIDLEPIYDALDIDGSPFCVILQGWLGDDSLILIGDDEALLKPERNKYCTFVRPTDGHQCAGPVLVLRQMGKPGSESDYWGPLTADQVNRVQESLATQGKYAR